MMDGLSLPPSTPLNRNAVRRCVIIISLECHRFFLSSTGRQDVFDCYHSNNAETVVSERNLLEVSKE